jgi:hypothetical protein
MRVFKQFQRLLPALYHQRFRLYFDRYGCIHCKRRQVLYSCSGLCISCLPLVDGRLRQVDKDMKKLYGGKKCAPAKRFPSGRESARQLLADLRGKAQETWIRSKKSLPSNNSTFGRLRRSSEILE